MRIPTGVSGGVCDLLLGRSMLRHKLVKQFPNNSRLSVSLINGSGENPVTFLCLTLFVSSGGTPCTGWVLNGTYMYSGDMRGRRLMDSVLQYKVDFSRAGNVEFEYKVDAERRCVRALMVAAV